nr:hypothetical protein [uncultured Undibacterium sp.]
MLKPINDGSAPFHDDPNDIAHHLRDNAIRNIQAGQSFISEVTLPFFEMEAISRIKKQTNICPENEPNRNKERELWRQKWVCEAQFAERNIYNYEPVAQAAIRVLLTSARLRSAIDDNSAPQMIAALSMLLACEVLEGGYMIKFESIKTENETVIKKEKETYIKSIGAESADQERARQACIVKAKEIWSKYPTKRIGVVAKELYDLLLENIEKLPTLDLIPAKDTIRGWLKQAGKDGKLYIPEAAQQRGRPKKSVN